MTDPNSSNQQISELIFADNQLAHLLFGEHQKNFELIKKNIAIEIGARGNHVKLKGSPQNIARVSHILNTVYQEIETGRLKSGSNIKSTIEFLIFNPEFDFEKLKNQALHFNHKNKTIRPKSANQLFFFEALKKFDVNFAVGPAGSGKTFLAVAFALHRFLKGDVERIILSRPALEAGEKLGFLPGDLNQKIDPYLRPLYDAMYELLDFEKIKDLIDNQKIEVIPLAFMRGRSLNKAFIILDEAQNTTTEQMKMFLTRLGMNSQMVVTGDITQIDLPQGQPSGLIDALNLFKNHPHIGTTHFETVDIVRNPLVKEIVAVYEKKGTINKRGFL